jgi:hypothetical protein
MVYVELWYDAEKDHEWKITLWQISDYDFDALTAPYITLDVGTNNQHTARELQLDIIRDLKKQTNVVANAYIDRSRFQIRPKWFEELLSPLGGITDGQADSKENRRSSRENRSDMLSNIRETYTIWFRTQGGTKTSGDTKRITG